MIKRLITTLLWVFIAAALLPGTAFAQGEVIELGDLAAFNTFSANVAAGDSYAGKTLRLTANITLPSGWQPVGWHGGSGRLGDCKTFAGTFDGNGKTVTLAQSSSLSLPYSVFTYVALFAHNTGTIENLTVAGGALESTRQRTEVYIAGIAAYNNGTVKNCMSAISFQGDENNSNKYLAGVVALNDTRGVVEGCGFSGSTTSGGMYKAGIVARNKGTVRQCYSGATIHFGYNKGGIVAVNETGATVTQCYYTGSNRYGALNGGIAHENKGTVSYCFFEGTLSGDNPAAIANKNSGVVTNCYTPSGHPLVRSGSGQVTNSYYDSQRNTAASQPGTGLPTHKMTQLTALSSGSMDALGGDTIWTVKANTENASTVTLYYPQLKYFADRGHSFLSANGARLSFDLNGAAGSAEPVVRKTGSAVTLPDIPASVVPAGATFSGWNTRPDGAGTNYAAGAGFTLDTNTTLYAKWNGTFDARLGSDSDNYDLSPGGSLHRPIQIQLYLGNMGRAPLGIFYGGAALAAGDYSVSGGTYTLEQSWLDTLSVGPQVLSFRLTKGNAAAELELPFTLNVSDSGPAVLWPTGQVTLRVEEGGRASMSVTARNAVSYCWQIDRADGNGFTALAASNAPSYTTSTQVTRGCDGFRYRCVVTGALGATVTSPVFTLMVVDKWSQPGTGDGGGLWLWLGLMCFSALALSRRARRERGL